MKEDNISTLITLSYQKSVSSLAYYMYMIIIHLLLFFLFKKMYYYEKYFWFKQLRNWSYNYVDTDIEKILNQKENNRSKTQKRKIKKESFISSIRQEEILKQKEIKDNYKKLSSLWYSKDWLITLCIFSTVSSKLIFSGLNVGLKYLSILSLPSLNNI